MREVLPAFNNLQDKILNYLDCCPLEYPDGKVWDSTDGHLKKLIERGFVKELPNGNFTLTTDLYGEALYNQLQWIEG